MGFHGGLIVKNPPANRGDMGLGLGRSPGKGNGYPLQEMDGGDRQTAVHGVTNS